MALGILRNHGRPSIKRLAGKKEPKNVRTKTARLHAEWGCHYRSKQLDAFDRTDNEAVKNQKATIGSDERAPW
jgi:hypothetical protein